MAETAVSVTTMTAGTVTADVITNAEGGTTVAAGNTALIDVGNETRNVIITIYGTGAATATIQAGDNPPAMRAGLGAGTAQTVPANDLLLLCVAGGQHMHDDGKIRIDIATNNVVVGAYRIPNTI